MENGVREWREQALRDVRGLRYKKNPQCQFIKD